MAKKKMALSATVPHFLSVLLLHEIEAQRKVLKEIIKMTCMPAYWFYETRVSDVFAPVAKSLVLVQLSSGILWQIHDARFSCLNESVR